MRVNLFVYTFELRKQFELYTQLYDHFTMFAHGDVFALHSAPNNILTMTRHSVSGSVVRITLPFVIDQHVSPVMWPIIHDQHLYYVVYRNHTIHIYEQEEGGHYTTIITHAISRKGIHKVHADHAGRLRVNNCGRVLETDPRGIIGFRYNRAWPYNHVFDVIWVNMRTFKIHYERVDDEDRVIAQDYRGSSRFQPLNYDRIRDIHYLITHNTDDDDIACKIATKRVIRSDFIAIILKISLKSVKLVHPDWTDVDNMQGGSSYTIWGSRLWFHHESSRLTCTLNVDYTSHVCGLILWFVSAEFFAPINEFVRIRGGFETHNGERCQYVFVYANELDKTAFYVDAELPVHEIKSINVHAIGSVP